jgi:hypothetical protein
VVEKGKKQLKIRETAVVGLMKFVSVSRENYRATELVCAVHEVYERNERD